MYTCITQRDSLVWCILPFRAQTSGNGINQRWLNPPARPCSCALSPTPTPARLLLLLLPRDKASAAKPELLRPTLDPSPLPTVVLLLAAFQPPPSALCCVRDGTRTALHAARSQRQQGTPDTRIGSCSDGSPLAQEGCTSTATDASCPTRHLGAHLDRSDAGRDCRRPCQAVRRRGFGRDGDGAFERVHLAESTTQSSRCKLCAFHTSSTIPRWDVPTDPGAR